MDDKRDSKVGNFVILFFIYNSFSILGRRKKELITIKFIDLVPK